ncbi:transporter [Paraburkholderia sp. BL21I4N1]|uniref:SphA family protein n=1 Tax=Paraburkholderia sp. BL21I4N1 TaxID=1938801 RepID=UPI000CFB2CBA|nr:transporter [Paraburkholderia sp. BL21I4N1]PQV43979.1 hypothetical protein B0G83_13034 [Paraburkholderia sp. BL21I4N1]
MKILKAVLFLIITSHAHGAESFIYGGPTGGTDIQNAFLPPAAGFYGALIAGMATGDRYYGDNGRIEHGVTINSNAGVAAVGLLYVYPFRIMGGSVGSSLMQDYLYGGIRANGVAQTFSGVGDMYSDILVWSKHIDDAGAGPTGVTIKVAYSMIFPTGKYNESALHSPGSNTFFYIPNVAITYLGRKDFLGDGLELDGHLFFNIPSENHADGYQSGTVADVDYAVSERFGRWQLGLAGYYAWQLGGDSENGQFVPPNGRHFSSAALGPVIAYDIPSLRANVKFKALLPVYTRNGLKTTTAYFVLSKAFK